MAKKKQPVEPYRFIIAVMFLCIVSVALLAARIISSDSMRYVFLLWNLVLAAVPALIAYWLIGRVKTYGWLAWQQIILSIVFLAFLPNSFYLLTDFVHIRETYEASLMFDVVLMASFMLSGLVLGYIAIYLVHRSLRERLSEQKAYSIVFGIILAASFAIYLGRFTRWNTWDLVFQPAGLLFDVSDRFVNPGVHADTYITTATLFLLIGGLYAVIYEGIQLARRV